MERFGPGGNFSVKVVHLQRCSCLTGRSGPTENCKDEIFWKSHITQQSILSNFWFGRVPFSLDWSELHGFRSYVSNENDQWKRNFSKTLCRVEIFENATFFLRFLKILRPLAAFSHRFRPSTRIRLIDLKTITYPTAHAWRIRVKRQERVTPVRHLE